MRITIDRVLDQNNKTRYWLSQTIDCNYQSLARLCNGETTAILFDLLSRICDALNCTPNDIMDIKD
jgi:putative transcriptional regulator